MNALHPVVDAAHAVVADGHATDAGAPAADGHGGTAGAHGDGGDSHGSSFSLVDGLEGWQTALVNVGAIAFVILAGIYLITPIFRVVSRTQLRELFVATALMVVVGIALLMTLVGLSPALGTFLAGVVLANSEYRHELESDIDPFKGLLLGLFFMTVGAGINFALLFDNLAIIVGLTLGVMLIKMLVLIVLTVIFNIRGADRWLFALGLAQAGEFGFVLLSFTVANGVLPSAIADQLLLVVALSMLLTPLLFILYDQVIAPSFSTVQDEQAADEIDTQSPIIIAGAGRVGGMVNRILRGAGYNPTLIDYSAEHLANMRTFGVRSFYGDATRPDLLQAAGLAEAKLLVIAIDDRERITELAKYVSETYPKVHIMARARDRHHVYELWSAGCRDIVRETYDSSLRMGRSAFEALGVSEDKARRMVDVFEDMDRRGMIEVADVFDPNIPATENDEYVARVRSLGDDWSKETLERMNAILDEPEGSKATSS